MTIAALYSPKKLAESSISWTWLGGDPQHPQMAPGLRPKLGVEPFAEGGALPSGPQKVPGRHR